jgi:phosphoribosyl 1,2-cyclic phosphodiesterase
MCYNGVSREGAILKVCVLASGSSGNSTLVSTARTKLLVDAGLSRRETCARLASIGEDPAKIGAILISHEHSDHVAGLPVLAKQLRVPVYLTHRTAPSIVWNGYEPKLETFQAGTRIVIGDLEIDTFSIPHDAIDPIGFRIRAAGVSIGLVTDLGYIPDSIKFHLRRTDLLLLESNHDVEMLKVGPYPWPVKQRIMSRNGHLSNDATCEFIRSELDSSTTTLVLGHLSEHNNYPALVRLCAEQALAGRALFTKLVIAEQGRPTEVFEY